MVRTIVLALFLTACASNQIKYGKEVAAPYGWQQWCIDNPTDKTVIKNKCHLRVITQTLIRTHTHTTK